MGTPGGRGGGWGTTEPGLPGTTLLQEPPPLPLLLQDFLFVTASQIDQDQGVIQQTVLHLFIQPGVSREARRVIDLGGQDGSWALGCPERKQGVRPKCHLQRATHAHLGARATKMSGRERERRSGLEEPQEGKEEAEPPPVSLAFILVPSS